ncbi:MAG: ribonuclease III [Isosphaeraceae bacterium]|nr:ribonuclease III [Isosphaeraceae bacterium]
MPSYADGEDDDLLERCQDLLRYTFRDVGLLKSALTHASGADHRLASNERLEFLGDAIFGAVVCELLYNKYPDFLEGELTRIKSVVVSRKTCAKISDGLGLDAFMVMGKGMGSQAETPASVLADVFESLIGALFLDGGLAVARDFIIEHIDPVVEETVEGVGGVNHKSQLQQLAQRQFGLTPTYLLLDVKGPDHLKCFKMAAQIGRRRFPAAWGRNKKDSEQRAAYNALCELNGEEIPHLAE